MTATPHLDTEVEFPDSEVSYVQAEADVLERLLSDVTLQGRLGAGATFCGGVVASTLLTSGVPEESWKVLILGVFVAGAIGLALAWVWTRRRVASQTDSVFKDSRTVVLRTKGFRLTATGELNQTSNRDVAGDDEAGTGTPV